jgi:hypothetical protein
MRTLLFALAAVTLLAQDYTGPTPPKADIPYLLHASTLIQTEATVAKEESKKGATLYWVEGSSSGVKTPLAEPIFIIRTEKLNAEKLELYKFEVKKGRRELEIKENPGKNDRPIHVAITKLGRDLYKIEASEQLANGEYGLSPGGQGSGTNDVFSFTVF